MNKVVYGWFDGEECFYVGIGNRQRPYTKNSRNKHCLNKRNKAERIGTFKIEIFATGLSHQEACNLECILIQQYGRRDLGTGCLTNMTDGGEGVKGQSFETRNKISKSKKGVKQTPEHIRNAAESKRGNKCVWYGKTGSQAPAYGYRHTKESRKRISEANKGRKGKTASTSKAVRTPCGHFESLDQAAQHFEVSPMTMTRWVRDIRKPEFELL